jgi:dolichol kinase
MSISKLTRELLRKLVHLLGLVLILAHALIYFHWSPRLGNLFLTLVLIVLIKFEYFRLEYRPRLPQILNLFRRKEKNQVAGWIFFVASMIIVNASFDYPIALAAMLMTVFGDMSAALFGIKFGRRKLWKNKTYIGFFAGLITNWISSAIILYPVWPVLLAMGLVASVVELFTNKLDDNLTVPIFSAATGQLAMYIWAQI